MQTILSVGEDPSLLYIRGLVLATTGAEVSSVSPAEGLRLLATSTFDLLVFCHSVRESDLLQLCEATRGWACQPRTLLLEIPGATFRPRPEMDSRHSLADGPGLLVKEVRALLGGAEPELDASGSRLIPFASAWRHEIHQAASQDALLSGGEDLSPGTPGLTAQHEPGAANHDIAMGEL